MSGVVRHSRYLISWTDNSNWPDSRISFKQKSLKKTRKNEDNKYRWSFVCYRSGIGFNWRTDELDKKKCTKKNKLSNQWENDGEKVKILFML